MIKNKDTLAYESNSLSIVHRHVEMNSIEHVYECVQRKEVVIVVPLLNEDHIVIIQQYRAPINQIIYEFPGGKVEAGEDIITAASRELREETGYRAGELVLVKSFFSAPHFTDEHINIFIANQLTKGHSNLQDAEFIETSTMSIQDLSTMIKKNEIIDSKTIIGYYCLINHLTSNK